MLHCIVHALLYNGKDMIDCLLRQGMQHIVFQRTITKAVVLEQALQCHLQIQCIIVQVMYTASYVIHSLRKGIS